MNFTDDFLNGLKKRKKQYENTVAQASVTAPKTTNTFYSEWDKLKAGNDADLLGGAVYPSLAKQIVAPTTFPPVALSVEQPQKTTVKESFDDVWNKKYSVMSLEEIEKEYAQIEKDEQAYKDSNGGKFANFMKFAFSPGESGKATREESETHIDTINDFTRKKEILSTYRKQKATEELLGSLSEEQISLLDDISKKESHEDFDELAPVINGLTGTDTTVGYAAATSYERDVGERSRNTLYEQLKEEYPDKNESELNELIDNMVELRKNQVNAEEQTKRDTEAKNLASKNEVGAFILSRGSNILGGPLGLAELYLQRDNEYGYDTNAAGFMLTNESNTIDKKIQADHDWTVYVDGKKVDAFDLVYSTGSGIVDNIGRFVMSGGNSTASSMFMFSQSMTQSIIDSKEKGYSDEKALTFGVLSGTFEAVSEKISLDIILKSGGSALKTLAKSFGTEGSEGLTSNWLNRIADEIANGKHSELYKMYEEYINEGCTESEALANVVCSIVDEDCKTFLMEGFAGLVMGGGVQAIQSIPTQSETTTINKLVEEKVTEATKQQAIENAVNKAVQERETEQGGKLSDHNKKALRETITAQIENGEIDISSEVLSKKDVSNIKKEITSALKDGKVDLSKIEEILTPDESKKINELKETLANTTDEQKIAEIEAVIKQLEGARASTLKNIARENKYLSKAVSEKVLGSQKYEYDSEVTDEYEKSVRDSAKKYLNNSTESKKYVDVIAKMAKDNKTRYIFTNNQALLEQGDLVARDKISSEDQAQIKALEKQLSEAKTKQEKVNIQAQIIALKYLDVGGFVRVNDTGVETILINVDTKQSLSSVAGHETKHILEKYGLNEEFNKILFEYAKTKGDLDAVKNRIEDIYKNQENVDIDGEVAAELVGKYLFEDEKFLETLMKSKSDSKVRQVIDKIKELIDDLVVRFKGTEQEKQLREVQKKFTELYNSTDADIVGETTEGTQYKLSDNARADVRKALKDKNFEGEIRLTDNSPSIMVGQKGVNNYPMLMNASHIRENIFTEQEALNHNLKVNDDINYHGLGEDLFFKVIDELDDVTLAYRGTKNADNPERREDYFLLISTYTDTNGDTINVPVYINRKGAYNRVFIDTNKIATVFGKENFNDYIRREIQRGNLVRIKKRSIQTSESTSPINADYGMNASSKNSLPQNSEKSTEKTKHSLSDSNGRELSSEQSEYFKNSKIRDANGDLKVMYHGSHENFTVFDKNKARSGGTYGKGFYFTDSKSHAGTYGDSYVVYLNITNPLQNGTNDITKDQLRKFVEALAENEDYGIENYGYEATIDSVVDSVYGKSDFGMLMDLNITCIGDMVEAVELFNEVNGTDYNGIVAPTETVAFFPEQIKDINNKAPTDNPDIRYSLSKQGEHPIKNGNYHITGEDIRYKEDIAPTVSKTEKVAPVGVAKNTTTIPDDFAPIREDEANAMLQEQNDIAPLTDADVPPEIVAPIYDGSDTKIDDTALKGIGQRLRETLSLTAKETKAIQEVVQKYSTTGLPDKTKIFDDIKEMFGEKSWKVRNEEIAEVKRTLKGFGIKVSDTIKSDIPDYSDWKKKHQGRLNFSEDGLTVDDIYEGLSIAYPGLFPDDIINPSDQLLRMAEIADEDIYTSASQEVDNDTIQQATDIIYDEVNKYKENELAQQLAEEQSHFYRSLAEETTENQHIQTVKERLTAKLENVRKELLMNQQLKDDSIADFEKEITRLQAVYDGKRDKNTKVANDILRRIERLQTLKGNVEADYKKRISDLEEKRVRLTKEMLTGESPTEQGAMRKELHERIIKNIKNHFEEKGFELDDVFRYAKNLSTFATVDNTPQRVMEKALGYKQGQILADETVNKVAQNESEGIKWLNSFTDPKTGLLAQISKEYHIKPGSKESAAAQMYAERFYVDENNDIVKYWDEELEIDFPDATVRQNIKGLANDPRIRQIYDETLDAINESRVRNAYPEIKKLDNYFLHFRAMEDTFSRIGLPFNPNDIKAKDLPTDLNGVTADLKPGKPYFASEKHRMGKRTSFDLLGGLERYLSSAKNQIYHIDDIQTLRALRNHIADTYGQAHAFEDIDSLTEEEVQERLRQVYNSHLSTFAKFLNEEANVIAGKTALIDRGLEGIVGRRGITLLDTINKQVGSNMVGFNVSSSLTNFLSVAQSLAKTSKRDSIKAFTQTVSNKINSLFGRSDDFAETNPGIVRRKGADKFASTPYEKVRDAGYLLASAVDNISTEFIVRTKFNEFTRKGMSEEQAHIEADKWASRLLGDRSLGQQPQLYNSKMLGLFTKFQLEVRNQLDTQFYDTIQEAKVSNEDIENALARNAKTAAKVSSTFLQLAVLQHVFGKAFETVAGYNPAFDIIDVLIKTFGFDDEEDDEDTPLDNLEQGFLALVEDLPYTSVLTGGRIPISSALPIKELVTGEDDYGTEKPRLETLAETLPYYLLPGGYGQLKKSTEGLKMFDDDLPVSGSYTDSGNLRFPVEKDPKNILQAFLFGQYANKNARDYFDNDIAPLKEKQIQEFIDVDMPIQDYWEYREGLSGLKTLNEKGDYIGNLDLPVEKKNILINNIADRKEPIDYTNYDWYADFEEFDFATRYPEKYKVLQEQGISVAEYKEKYEETAFMYTDDFAWASQNPEKYTLSKAVTDDVMKYKQYTTDLYNIKADKDSNGKSISGSRKSKVIKYIQSLDVDYGAKCILLKSEYESDDTYNTDIVKYLKNRKDLSMDEKTAILEELGATVDDEGYVHWN